MSPSRNYKYLGVTIVAILEGGGEKLQVNYNFRVIQILYILIPVFYTLKRYSNILHMISLKIHNHMRNYKV